MSRIVIVGEAWGRDEEEVHAPFVGASGRLLNALLSQVGINRSDTFLTNVFNLRPRPTNDVKNLCGSKAEGIKGWPALQPGKYVKAIYAEELDRLFQEIRKESPTLIIALGATPSWALLRTSGIRAHRGVPSISHLGIKVLPTYHPAAIMRDFSLRPIIFADLSKAKREAEFPEVRRPQREVWIEPSIADLDIFAERYIMPSSELSIDIETKGDMITCVGFAPTPSIALVVPFYDPTQTDHNYWRTHDEERQAWLFVKHCCALAKRFVFQNGLFDIHLLWRMMGIPVNQVGDDTMLLHHALQPEMQKGLGFLGSIYTDEASWKIMRKDTLKQEE